MYMKNGVIRKGLIVRNPIESWDHPARASSPYGEDAGLGYRGYGSPYGFYGGTKRKCLKVGDSGADVKFLQNKLGEIALADPLKGVGTAGTWLAHLYHKGKDHNNTLLTGIDPVRQFAWAVEKDSITVGNSLSETQAAYFKSKGESFGTFKSPTQAAVMSFQKDKGLTIDGVVGPDTWAKLGEVGKSCGGGGGGSGSSGGTASSSGSGTGAAGGGLLAAQGIWPFDFNKAMKSWVVWTVLGGGVALTIAIAATRKKSPKEQEALEYDALTVMSNPLAALQLGGSYRTNPHCTAGLKPNPKKRRNRRKKRRSRKRRR